MKKLSLSILLWMTFVISIANNFILEKVYFEKDKDSFNATEMSEDIFEGTLFHLNGYADSEGDEVYNLDLSKRRVDAVKDYLISQGIEEQFIHTSFLGERPGDSYTVMKENRVVEINYIIDPLMQHKVEIQEFPIKASEETIITGKHGTIVSIPANAFFEENVVITLKEYYDPLEIMSANLSTVSNGRNLETAGMVYIEAKSNGGPITPQADLEFSFAAQKEKEDFELFTGEVGQDLNVNWKAVDEDVLEETVLVEGFDVSGTSWLGWFTFDNARAAESLLLNHLIGPKLFGDFGKAISKGKLQLIIKKDGSVIISKAEFQQASEKELKGIMATINTILDKQDFKASSEECELVADFDEVTDQHILDYAVNNTVTSKAETKTSNTNPVVSSPTQTLQTRTLGWINCDRYRNNKNLVNFQVKVGYGVNVRMIVKEYKSYFNSAVKQGNYQFADIPNNEEVYLIALVKQDDKYLLAIEDVVTSTTVFTDFNFEALTYDEMIEKLAEIKL